MNLRRLSAARITIIAVVLSGLAAAPAAADGSPPHDPNHILVGWPGSLLPAERAAVHASLGTTVANTFDWLDVDVVRVPQGVTPPELVERYQADGRVKYAELNFLRQLHGTPNDTYFNDLWGLHNTGTQFLGYTADADIDGPEGWDVGYGVGQFPNSGGIRVGVVDTGISSTHTEFSGGKIKACARATSGSGAITNGTCPDDHGHGTHVAGTIAAHANNGTGIAGVAPASELAIGKACTGAGCYDSDSIATVNWLRNSGGARVINMSLGGPNYGNSFASEVQAAYNAGVLLVASAGNDGNATVNYPAGYTSVMSVAALDGNDTRASFSNYNSDVEVIAPGVNIRSTVPTNSYAYSDGTSMASPHVAGVGALVMAAAGVDNATARSLMNSTAVDRGSTGRDNFYGYGRVNLAAALNASPLKPAITSPADGASFNTTTITVSGTGKANAPLQVREGATVLASTTVSASKTWSTSVTLGQGSHQLTAVADPGTGAEKISDPRTVSIDSIAPAAPVITSPTPGQVVASTSVTISGTAEPAATVTLSKPGSTLATTTAQASGAWSVTLQLAQGAHTVDAVARDAATNVSPASSVSFTMAVPPPGPTIITPAPNEHVLNGSAVNVSGTSSDATLIRVKEGTSLRGTATPAADGSWSVVLSFPDGPHTIAVTSLDADGDESSATTRSFLVGTAPFASITTPAADSINPGTVQITGIANPGSTVRIYEGGLLIASGSANSSGNYTMAKPMGEGSHTITARAELGGVQGGPSEPRTFVVDVRDPILTVYTADPSVVPPTRNPGASGYVVDDKGLGRITIEFTRLGSTAPPSSRDAECESCATALESEWVSDFGNLAPGYYTATITAIDKAGNESRPKTIRFVTT